MWKTGVEFAIATLRFMGKTAHGEGPSAVQTIGLAVTSFVE
jgi:hypothetical protein